MNLDEVDLNKLATFLAIAEAGGVSAAARRLGVTRSAVSQSLARFEASLDVQLFQRLGRRLVPTREAELLVHRLRDYQHELERTLAELSNRKRVVRGTVRVGLFQGFSRLRLSGLVSRFLEAYPEANVRVSFGSRAEIEERLLAGRLDFVFSLEARRAARSRIRATRLLDQELVLVAARRLARGGPDPSRFAELPVVDYYPGDPLIDRWLAHHYGRRAPRPRVRAWAATTDLVLELVLLHVGVAVLPLDLVEPLVRRRRLVVWETGRPQLRDSIWLEEPLARHQAARLQAFRKLVLSDTGEARTSGG